MLVKLNFCYFQIHFLLLSEVANRTVTGKWSNIAIKNFVSVSIRNYTREGGGVGSEASGELRVLGPTTAHRRLE